MRIKQHGPNQTSIVFGNGVEVFFSYETPVAVDGGMYGGMYRTEEKFSVTTSRHINKWLGGCTAEVVPQSKIEQIANTGGACLR